MNLYELALVNSASLAPVARSPVPFVPTVQDVEPLSVEELAATQLETLNQLKRVISRERVRNFANEFLGDRTTRTASELPLQAGTELPLLIYLRAYGGGELGYQIQPEESGAWIQHGMIGFRDFVMSKIAEEK
jgi:hypothetical protein